MLWGGKKVEMVIKVVMKVDVELWWCVNIPNNRKSSKSVKAIRKF